MRSWDCSWAGWSRLDAPRASGGFGDSQVAADLHGHLERRLEARLADGDVAHLAARAGLALAVEVQVGAGMAQDGVPARLARRPRCRPAGSPSRPACAASHRPAAVRTARAPAARTARCGRRRWCSGRCCAGAARSRSPGAARPPRTSRRRGRPRSPAPARCASRVAVASAASASGMRAGRDRDVEDAAGMPVLRHREDRHLRRRPRARGSPRSRVPAPGAPRARRARASTARRRCARSSRRGDRRLALAVVAEARRLEDGGQAHARERRVEIGFARARRHTGPTGRSCAAMKPFSRLRSCATATALPLGRTSVCLGQRKQGLGRRVLEFRGHGRAGPRQFCEGGGVGVGGVEVPGGELRRRATAGRGRAP